MSEHRPKVLIVDDDDAVVLALHRALYTDNPRYDVLLAGSAEIAQRILAETRVDVLVTDVLLPEKSGMDLLGWVAAETPSTRVIVMTGLDVHRIRDRAHAFGCLRLVRKPIDVHEMRDVIVRALSVRDAFSGQLSELSLVDVIQTLCLARKSAAIRVSEGEHAGVVHLAAGEIVHAVWDGLTGEEALFPLLGVKKGQFSTVPLPADVERTIFGDWQHLMIEGLRRLDEQAAGVEAARGASTRPPPPADPPVTVDSHDADAQAPFSFPHPAERGGGPSLPRTTFGSAPSPRAGQRADEPGASRSLEVTRLIDEGWSAMRANKHDDARRAWAAALRLDAGNRMIALNLRKLGVEAGEAGTG